MNAKAHNIRMVETVALGFKDLLSEMVFVGGATTTLYLSEQETKSESSVRPTDDVDCSNLTDYHKLEGRIRGLGFKNSMEQGAPLCRWIYSGITVDIMPADPTIIGFSNKWYKGGIASSVLFNLPCGLEIRIFSVPYFLATKMEAFKDRGKSDFLGSRDFEDIITIVDGKEDIQKHVFDSPEDVKTYLQNQFRAWIANEDFLQSLAAHLPPDRHNVEGARRLLDIVKSL